MSAPSMTRLDELQADDAIWGLDASAGQELVDALREAAVDADPSWERCAALTTIALQERAPAGPSEGLLRALRAASPLPADDARPRWWSQPNAVLAAALLTLSAVLWWTREQATVVVAPQVLRQELLQVGHRGLEVVRWRTEG